MKAKYNACIRMSFSCNYIQHIKEARQSIVILKVIKSATLVCCGASRISPFSNCSVLQQLRLIRALKQLPSANPCSRIAAFSSPSNRQAHLSVQKLHQGNTEGRKKITPSKGLAEQKAYSQRCRYRLKFLLIMFFLLSIPIKYIRKYILNNY